MNIIYSLLILVTHALTYDATKNGRMRYPHFKNWSSETALSTGNRDDHYTVLTTSEYPYKGRFRHAAKHTYHAVVYAVIDVLEGKKQAVIRYLNEYSELITTRVNAPIGWHFDVRNDGIRQGYVIVVADSDSDAWLPIDVSYSTPAGRKAVRSLLTRARRNAQKQRSRKRVDAIVSRRNREHLDKTDRQEKRELVAWARRNPEICVTANELKGVANPEHFFKWGDSQPGIAYRKGNGLKGNALIPVSELVRNNRLHRIPKTGTEKWNHDLTVKILKGAKDRQDFIARNSVTVANLQALVDADDRIITAQDALDSGLCVIGVNDYVHNYGLPANDGVPASWLMKLFHQNGEPRILSVIEYVYNR